MIMLKYKKFLLGSLVLVAVLSCLGFFYNLGVIPPVMRTHRMDLNKVHPESGGKSFCFLYPFSLYPGDTCEEPGRSWAQLLEDGQPLGPAHSLHADIRKKGAGRYSHWDWNKSLYFSTSDNTDPRFNGRTYELRYNWQAFSWVLVVLPLICLLLNAERLSKFLIRMYSVNPAWLFLVIVLVAGLFRLFVAAEHWNGSIGGLFVKGMPFTDGRGWHSLSVDFSRGERWSSGWSCWGARRPFYYIFMGSIFALTVPTVAMSQIVNGLLGALSSGLIFDLVRRIAPMPIALLTALGQAFFLQYALYGLTTATVTLGSFLSIFSIWMFVWGAERILTKNSTVFWPKLGACLLYLWPFLASGSLLALSNLTRPLTLIAVMILPLLFASILFRCKRFGLSARWRLGLMVTIVFCAGTVLTITPWIIRQNTVYGITSISDNSAEMLYAATTPEFGSWSSKVSQLAKGMNLRERHKFYQEGIRQNLRKHFGWYIGHVYRYIGLNCRYLTPPAWLLLATCGLFFLHGYFQRQSNFYILLATVAIAMLGIVLLPSGNRHWIWIAASVVSLFWPKPVALLTGLLFSGLLVLGLTAFFGDPRLIISLSWLANGLTIWFVWQILAWLNSRRFPTYPWFINTPVARDWGAASKVVHVFAIAGSLFFFCGLARAVYANFSQPQNPPKIIMQGENKNVWIQKAIQGNEYVAYEFLEPYLQVYHIFLEAKSTARFEAEERVDHWSAIFRSRPYGFEAFTCRPSTPVFVFPGKLKPVNFMDELFVVGIPVSSPETSESWFEVIAIGHSNGPSSPVSLLRPDPGVVDTHAAFLRAAAHLR